MVSISEEKIHSIDDLNKIILDSKDYLLFGVDGPSISIWVRHLDNL